jgi:hypothetical protein
MNPMLRIAAPAIFLVASSIALATPRLTPAQCNDYPFKRPVGEVTRAQLTRELAELEAVGYHPSNENVEYPDDLQAAEQKLQAEYQHDCHPGSSS